MNKSKFTNVSPKEYVTKDASRIRELLNPEVAPGLNLSLAEAVVEAGQCTLKHWHGVSNEVYYCLEGTGILYIDDEPYNLEPHSFYLLPKACSHYLEASTRVRLLCICQPPYTHQQTTLIA